MRNNNQRILDLVALILPGLQELCEISGKPLHFAYLPFLINRSKDRMKAVIVSGTDLQKRKAEILLRDLEGLVVPPLPQS